jgi:cell pole-organizing protein PopZ
MGDVSNEPSMEDILSSIKRIIAEEGESAVTARTRRPARAASPAPVADEDEILELSEPVPAESRQAGEAAPEPVQAAAPAEPILSATTAQASRGPLEALSRLIVKPDVAGTDTLEGLVREMLRPMLREWLDANLPRMVEEMVQREIARITAGRD